MSAAVNTDQMTEEQLRTYAAAVVEESAKLKEINRELGAYEWTDVGNGEYTTRIPFELLKQIRDAQT